MTMNLSHLQRIEDVPFATIMQHSGTSPVLLDFLRPDMDVMIWLSENFDFFMQNSLYSRKFYF